MRIPYNNKATPNSMSNSPIPQPDVLPPNNNPDNSTNIPAIPKGG